MKKVIKTMMMMLVASAFVLTSCKDSEDPDDVSLTINPSATSGVHFVYDTLKITVNAKGNADNKLKSLKITKAPAGKPTTTITDEKLSGTDKIHNIQEVYQLTDEGTITYTITLEGEKGNAKTITYVATVKTAQPISVLPSNISFRGQLNSGGDHFLGLNQGPQLFGIDLSSDDWANEVDFVYYFGTNNKHTLVSPTNQQMQTDLYSGLKNRASDPIDFSKSRKTEFYKLTAAEQKLYTDLAADPDDDRDLQAFAQGKTWTEIVPNLINGDVILYRNKDGEIGLIRLFSATGSTATDAEFQFRMIYQG